MELIITIREKSWFDKFLWGALILMSAITIISYIEDYAKKDTIFIFTGFFIIITTFYDEIYRIKHKPFEELGRIILSNDDVIIHEKLFNKRIRYEELEYLKLELNETSLDKYFRGTFNKKKDGDKNYIEIKQLDGSYFKFNTFIENAEKIKGIDEFVDHLNRKEIKLIRQGKVVKTILDLHYRDYPKEYFNTSGKRNYKD